MKMKDMRRWIACLAVVLLCMQTAVADEGMWLINRLGEIYPQMKSKGLKIKDKEIYNEQTSALADAVVAVDGGMGTGSMISDEGLMITNHHSRSATSAPFRRPNTTTSKRVSGLVRAGRRFPWPARPCGSCARW